MKCVTQFMTETWNRVHQLRTESTMNTPANDALPLIGGQPRALVRLAIVTAGILLGQCYLYWPALCGNQILLPVDLLAMPRLYTQSAADVKSRTFSDWTQSDQILAYEPSRRFVASELRAGRWPAWSPYTFCGSPTGGTQWSCFQCLYVFWPNPRILVVMQVLVAFVAGFGAYLFLRQILGLLFWPAAIASWCYPLTGFFVLWQGHSLSHTAAWLPWVLWLTDRTVRQPLGLAGVGLAIVTFLTIGTGAVDIAGQVLLVSGCYAIFRIAERSLFRWTGIRQFLLTVISPATGWALGFLLASGMLLPLASYLSTGARMHHRSGGSEERKPTGIEALPLIALPDIQGSTRAGSYYIRQGGAPAETAAAGYAGLIAILFLAPLAGFRRPYRAEICFWWLFGFLGIAWALNVPGIVHLYRVPALNMFSFNRFVFVTGWSITCLAALGLDHLWRGAARFHQVHFVLMILLVACAVILLGNAANLPEPLASILEKRIRAGESLPNLQTVDDLVIVKRWFVTAFGVGATSCFVALICWIGLISRRIPQRLLFIVSSIALLLEVVWHAAPSALMSDPKDYYPPIPVLEQLVQAPTGRVIGMGCLPPRLLEFYGLRDVRGYDGVDPAGIVDLLFLVRNERYPVTPYALTQWYVPLLMKAPNDDIKLPGVLNLLNLRYLIFLKPPSDKLTPFLAGDGFWIWENRDALPRAFIPRSITNDLSGTRLLAAIGDPDFDAAEHSYAEIATNYSDCRGKVQILQENPREIVLEVQMETPGMVVLSDLWYAGWQAELNGIEVPIVRANHSLRGVEVPANKSTVVMRYNPPALTWGLRLSAVGIVICAIWTSLLMWCRLRPNRVLPKI